MKVTIGGYKRWFGPYQLADALCFWAKPVKDEFGIMSKPNWVHRFGELLAYGSIRPEPEPGDISDLIDDNRKPTWLNRFLSWAHSKQSRTISVRIDRWDTWSMDDTLAHIILPMLRQLNETKHGAPFVDDEDVPEELKSTSAPPKENDYDTDDNHFLRWDWVMGEMIFAFDTLDGGANADWEEQFTTGEYDLRFKKISENGTSEMIRGPGHTAETDWAARKEYAERIQNGFRLFGKYFQNLWD
jgi:hypothetical protein